MRTEAIHLRNTPSLGGWHRQYPTPAIGEREQHSDASLDLSAALLGEVHVFSRSILRQFRRAAAASPLRRHHRVYHPLQGARHRNGRRRSVDPIVNWI